MEETITILSKTDLDTDPVPVQVPRRIGHVKLGEMLGEGAGGAVFSAYDEALDRRVAVKLLHSRRGDPDDTAMVELVEGVRSAARIKHPNVVTVHNVDTVNGIPVIVMEYIDGVSLKELLRRTGPLDTPLALYVMRSIASAVAALHEENVLHRDLKPANTMFDRDGQVHVCDFGLACEFDVGRFEGGSQTRGGSPLYMAPEVYEGHVSPQSDVYALGVMLFELLVGQPPFSADTIDEMQACHVAGDVPVQLLERRGIPAEVCDVVHRALHKQRILRFKTAERFLRALEALEAGRGRDDAHAARMAAFVGAQPHEAPAAEVGELSPPPAQTTYDLVAQRARRKRESRSDE